MNSGVNEMIRSIKSRTKANEMTEPALFSQSLLSSYFIRPPTLYFDSCDRDHTYLHTCVHSKKTSHHYITWSYILLPTTRKNSGYHSFCTKDNLFYEQWLLAPIQMHKSGREIYFISFSCTINAQCQCQLCHAARTATPTNFQIEIIKLDIFQ